MNAVIMDCPKLIDKLKRIDLGKLDETEDKNNNRNDKFEGHKYLPSNISFCAGK